MRVKSAVFAWIAGAVLAAGPAFAICPQPAKPVPANLYSGRWYEIARTSNKIQSDCQGSTNDFSGWASGVFSVVQTCHRGTASGPTHTFSARGHILPASANAKMRLGYFGGLISQEYWIVDRSDDNAWAIKATPNGRYVWLISRQPVLDAEARARALGRLQALGFDLTRLAFPQQLPLAEARLTQRNEGGTR
jgi:apolipoprotein D and lipocalin family protein